LNKWEWYYWVGTEVSQSHTNEVKSVGAITLLDLEVWHRFIIPLYSGGQNAMSIQRCRLVKKQSVVTKMVEIFCNIKYQWRDKYVEHQTGKQKQDQRLLCICSMQDNFVSFLNHWLSCCWRHSTLFLTQITENSATTDSASHWDSSSSMKDPFLKSFALIKH
jgi:hypothetical protein